ncbi:MAG TPA: cupin domain-containing protein [Vicinamibacterales bacterium]|nr:cupin domain-containing protein [Vicinamibacterales bacterium]
MTAPLDEIRHLVRELRAITAGTGDSRIIVERVRPLIREVAVSRRWLKAEHFACDPVQGFGAHLLHEQPDHTLAIFAGAWLPGRGAPPHNHGTWAVVAGVVGSERNTLWTRIDDGSRRGHAELRRLEDCVLGPGDVLTLQPDTIHSVVNESQSVTVSLHVYGTHVNHTERSQFDPERHTERAFIITTA